ncbi:hypothetical protein F5Y08DRAFT_262760 [Xylaria arbuscula]|nr:hypothetical protein F5Y08DRAFT_262760 [Xylaria arbuscula]
MREQSQTCCAVCSCVISVHGRGQLSHPAESSTPRAGRLAWAPGVESWVVKEGNINNSLARGRSATGSIRQTAACCHHPLPTHLYQALVLTTHCHSKQGRASRVPQVCTGFAFAFYAFPPNPDAQVRPGPSPATGAQTDPKQTQSMIDDCRWSLVAVGVECPGSL